MVSNELQDDSIREKKVIYGSNIIIECTELSICQFLTVGDLMYVSFASFILVSK